MESLLQRLISNLIKFTEVSLIAASLNMFAQKPNIGHGPVQEARNSLCSNVIATHGDVTIKCSGLTVDQANQLKLILNTILQERLDTSVVLQKLQDIQHGVSSIQTQMDLEREQADQADRLRRTAPLVDAYLRPLGNGKVRLYMKSLNLIPFEYIERIVTRNDLIVAPIAFTMQTVYPTSGNDLFYFDVDLHMDQIKESYVELRWTYQSLSYEELHLPGHEGKIVRKYKIDNDGASLTETE